jgi:V/A-type H+-transporting ATPase subunit I
MAIAPMKKVYLVAHNSEREKIVWELQDQGLVQITNLRKKVRPETEADLQEYGEIHQLQSILSKIRFCLEYISRFEEKSKSFFSSLVPDRIAISRSVFDRIEEKLSFEEVFEECESLEIKLTQIEAKAAELVKKLRELKFWLPLKMPLSFAETRSTRVFAGEVLEVELNNLEQNLSEKVPESETEVVSRVGGRAYVIVFCHKERESETLSFLNQAGFKLVTPYEFKGTPAEESRAIREELAMLNKERAMVVARSRQLLKLKPDLLTAHDFILNKLKRLEVQANFAETKSSFMLEGWVRAKDTPKLKKAVNSISAYSDIVLVDPEEGETPPVILENSSWLKPFEIVTQLYGLPKYRELDPTPFLAPFFIAFFGLALGDVGYGFILAFASWLAIKKIPFSEPTKKFLRLLIYGGFSSMVAGIITGSWFTVDTKVLPLFLRKLIIFDPLKNPQALLMFSLVLGFIQLYFGVILSLIGKARQGKLIDGLLEDGSVLIFLPGAVMMIILFLGAGKVQPSWAPIAKWIFIAGIVGIILFSNRQAKNIATRVGSGLYRLYGMTSFLGDTISYARLMALGLATFIIGWSINLLAGMISSIPIIGLVITIVVLVFGHLFNLLINLIGAFVHPARLQYVEFFSKFFKSGGHKFTPFSIETKNLLLTYEQPETQKSSS